MTKTVVLETWQRLKHLADVDVRDGSGYAATRCGRYLHYTNLYSYNPQDRVPMLCASCAKSKGPRPPDRPLWGEVEQAVRLFILAMRYDVKQLLVPVVGIEVHKAEAHFGVNQIPGQKGGYWTVGISMRTPSTRSPMYRHTASGVKKHLLPSPIKNYFDGLLQEASNSGGLLRASNGGWGWWEARITIPRRINLASGDLPRLFSPTLIESMMAALGWMLLFSHRLNVARLLLAASVAAAPVNSDDVVKAAGLPISRVTLSRETLRRLTAWRVFARMDSWGWLVEAVDQFFPALEVSYENQQGA